MKRLLILVCLFSPGLLFAGIVVKPVPISQQEMEKKGIRIQKRTEDSPVPVSVIEIEVALPPEEGSFEQSILIVASAPVTSDSLRSLDSYYESHAVRTERTKERKVSFSVFGKEAKAAYIAVVVLVGFDKMAIYHRYLLPVSEMQDEKKKG